MDADIGDKVYFGFFEDFLDPTILFLGSSEALRKFADFLNSLGIASQNEFHLNELPLFVAARNTNIWLERVENPYGMKRITNYDPATFRWGISKKLATSFATSLQSVIFSDKPCHQYLDTNAMDDVIVLVSKGEYEKIIFAARHNPR
jgi:hypothetical protein